MGAIESNGSSGTYHPAPQRDRVRERTLWFGLFAAPAMWSVVVIAGFAVTAHGCYPRSIPLADSVIGGMRVIAIIITAIATVVSVAAGVVSLGSWRRTSSEMAGQKHALLEVGEGRTRFMALSGVLVSVLFLLAIVLNFLSIAFVPPCTYGA